MWLNTILCVTKPTHLLGNVFPTGSSSPGNLVISARPQRSKNNEASPGEPKGTRFLGTRRVRQRRCPSPTRLTGSYVCIYAALCCWFPVGETTYSPLCCWLSQGGTASPPPLLLVPGGPLIRPFLLVVPGGGNPKGRSKPHRATGLLRCALLLVSSPWGKTKL